MNTTHPRPRTDWLRAIFWLAVLVLFGLPAVLFFGWLVAGLWMHFPGGL